MINKQEHLARSIVQRLTEHGYKALFVGGWVRDKLLGLSDSGDIDIATDAHPEDIANIFDHVVPVGEKFGVMLVVKSGIPFEVATFRVDEKSSDGRHPDNVRYSNPQDDAKRRDFTINGLFMNPFTGEIIDFVGGRNDLKKKLIRAIGNPQKRFREDYLRIIRAIRFSARFKFLIETDTWRAITSLNRGILEISQERIFQELTKILTGQNPDIAIRLLYESGILLDILPEVHNLVGVEQPKEYHPEGDVFEHTLKALSLMENPTPISSWSVLLHDIGKPDSMTHKVGDRIRFNGHDILGAKMSKKVLTRLKAPKKIIDSVYDCIANHMSFINVTKMRLSKLKRFISRNTIEDELELHRVDCLSSHGDLGNYNFVKNQISTLSPELVRPKPFITGKDIINLGVKQGPVFGKIMKKAYDLQLEEIIKTRETALDWLVSHYKDFN